MNKNKLESFKFVEAFLLDLFQNLLHLLVLFIIYFLSYYSLLFPGLDYGMPHLQGFYLHTQHTIHIL